MLPPPSRSSRSIGIDTLEAGLLVSYRDVLLDATWPDVERIAAIAIAASLGVALAILLLRRLDHVYPKLPPSGPALVLELRNVGLRTGEGAVRDLCERVVWIDRGRVAAEGVGEVLEAYLGKTRGGRRGRSNED